MRLALLFGTVGAGIISSHVLAEKERESKHLQKGAALGLMASALVHELSQPLTTVQALAQNVLIDHEEGKAVSSEAMLSAFEAIEEQTKRMADLRDSLLRFARMTPIKREPVDINQCVRCTLTFIETQLKHRGIRVKKSFGKLPQIHGNYVDLQQLVLNLLLNARDAMHETEEKLLSVKTTRYRGQVRITIQDTGTGITPEDVGSVFEPFFTTKGVGEGTGLGLPVSQAIAEQHGGAITLKTTLGRGSTFTVALPVNVGS